MNRVIKILMDRDGMTQRQAEAVIDDVIQQMDNCNYDSQCCDEIFVTQLGLELDYLPDIL